MQSRANGLGVIKRRIWVLAQENAIILTSVRLSAVDLGLNLEPNSPRINLAFCAAKVALVPDA